MISKRLLTRNKILPALVVLGLLAYQYYYLPGSQSVDYDAASAGNAVQQAYAAQRSGLWLETSGRVRRMLKDDNVGARHQKFILEVAGGHTVLVSHNIDLADRVPVRQGTQLVLRGRYEWNDRGGVIHWTHHDPDGRLQGGWIEAGGECYQ